MAPRMKRRMMNFLVSTCLRADQIAKAEQDKTDQVNQTIKKVSILNMISGIFRSYSICLGGFGGVVGFGGDWTGFFSGGGGGGGV